MFDMAGYPSLAALMGRSSGMAVFRQFSNLNLLNLLYLQAEIAALEDELKVLVQDDRDSQEPDRSRYHLNAKALKNSVQTGDDLQWRKLLEIRGKLTEYSKY
jgi:hypothetical protein